MPRVIWKGSISFGLVNVPIGLYSAVSSSDRLSFTQLDSRDRSPVGYRRVNKETGEEVDWDDIVKGYEYEEGKYVIMGDEDFQAADRELTRTVEILHFVEGSEIETMFFDKPYYLVPQKGGEKGYALLRETLRRTDKVGIASVVLKTRQHIGALLARDRALVLELLHFSHELRNPDQFDLPGEDLDELGVREQEVEMARNLVEGMVEPWEPEQYRDEYRDAVLERIREKVEAGETEAVTEPEEPAPEEEETQVVDMMDLLKRSLEREQERAG